MIKDVLTGTLTNNHFAYPAIGRGSQKSSPISQQPSSLAKNMEPVPMFVQTQYDI